MLHRAFLNKPLKMNKWIFFCVLGSCLLRSMGRLPFQATPHSLPFMVYYASRYRGICSGVLASRSVVVTAAVCVTNPFSKEYEDRRSINVVIGTYYRHPNRGVRVQVSTILLPNLSREPLENKGYLMQKSVAVMLLKRKVPDVLVDVPPRAITLDWRGDETIPYHEECFMAGWHYFYLGNKVFPIRKFLLQRRLRVQFLNVVRNNVWCEPLAIKFQMALTNLGFTGYFDRTAVYCVKDPDNTAQPCHGMYGSPLVCRGKVVGMMTAPDAQWTNCTGFCNTIHKLSSQYLKKFMSCVHGLFDPDKLEDWAAMKKAMYDENPTEYDYVPSMYDKLTGDSSSSETAEY